MTATEAKDALRAVVRGRVSEGGLAHLLVDYHIRHAIAQAYKVGVSWVDCLFIIKSVVESYAREKK